MFDVVAPYQDQSPATVHGGGVDHGQARHPSAIGIGTQAVAGESANQPSGEADQCQDDHEREYKLQWLHALSLANNAFFTLLGAGRKSNATPGTAKRSLRLALTLNSRRQYLPSGIPYITHESAGPKRLLEG
jgi:hypothetical protein